MTRGVPSFLLVTTMAISATKIVVSLIFLIFTW